MLAIAIATLLVYARAGGHGFIHYDDDQYVFDNPHVASGLGVENFLWAFRTGHAANWHPLTWLSHQLDCQLFGLNPGPHHLTNVVLHCASAVLLFTALNGMTGLPWRSAMVSMLFALHPSRVESVAWISERKDVLGAFFWMLSLLLYQRYCARPSGSRYGLLTAVFALGLMSKPMVVTLPCTLLLLDYWPLGRLRTGADLGRRVGEKLPLFAMAAATSVVTFLVQNSGGAVVPIETVSLASRIGNASLTYWFYLWKTFWPSPLFIPYWYDLNVGIAVLLGAGLMLMLLTVAAIRFGGRKPYLPVGWLWYLGTLLPVIGLVQVGAQTAADRYTYIPTIGIYLLVVWGTAELFQSWRVHSCIKVGAAASVMAVCMLLTSRQIGCWKNGETLFQHTLEADPPNLLAMKLLAWTYATDLNPKVRNGARAVELASFTSRIMEGKDAMSLRVLAAGFAELGEFPRAVEIADEALQLPHAKSQPQFSGLIQSDLDRYRAGQPVYGEIRPRVRQ